MVIHSILNTSAKINLINNTIVNNDTEGNFLRAKADSWGNNGSNGRNVILTMNNQEAIGNIVIDSVSTITLTGDSYVTSLEDEDSSYSNINFNGYKLYVNGKAINS